MPAPSVKTALDFLDLGHEDATVLVAILKRALGSSQRVEAAMKASNELVSGHGVEVFRGKSGDVVALYVNVGDPYAGTVIYNVVTEAFAISTVADWLTTYASRYGIA